jgi:hypothetical protein
MELRQPVDAPVARVVAGLRILFAGIAEADYHAGTRTLFGRVPQQAAD